LTAAPAAGRIPNGAKASETALPTSMAGMNQIFTLAGDHILPLLDVLADEGFRQSRVFCVTGAGAFGFNGMELDTAVRHGLEVVTLLGNDAAWGIDKNIQLGLYGKAVVSALRLTRYDIVAQGLGAHGELVERPEQLAPALERALAAGKPSLLDIRVRSQISPRAQALVDRRKSTGGF
jgi:thiamine pyrophosphate-dependent acetolactate synthase large subunit-like protein